MPLASIRSTVSRGRRLVGAIAWALLLAVAGRVAVAEDPRIVTSTGDAAVTDEKRTLLDLYLRMEQAAAYLTGHPDMVLIDVRPGPIAGMAPSPRLAAGHVPILVERERQSELPSDPDLPVAGMRLNPVFAEEVEQLLRARGLGRDATIMLYCGIGIFSARASDLLAERGYRNVYSILDGVAFGRTRATGAGPAN
jgi:rhodanese-related sulfurtransferase